MWYLMVCIWLRKQMEVWRYSARFNIFTNIDLILNYFIIYPEIQSNVRGIGKNTFLLIPLWRNRMPKNKTVYNCDCDLCATCGAQGVLLQCDASRGSAEWFLERTSIHVLLQRDALGVGEPATRLLVPGKPINDCLLYFTAVNLML